MFTGIIEHVGTVEDLDLAGASARLSIAAPGLADELRHGESVAVDGVCLTVAEAQGPQWSADLMRVTLEHTTLGALRAGDRVNLERAVRADGRLGGHIVQGHADGVGELVSRDSQPEWDDFSFAVPDHLTRYIALKGSIAINGVSLTVARLDGAVAGVSLIPTTLADTTLGSLQVGDRVNIEVDVLAKYVEKMLGGDR